MFLYTAIILVMVIAVMFIFFSDQIRAVVSVTQQRQQAAAFQPLLSELPGKTEEELIAFVEEFHAKNASFDFCIETADGRILYQTENFKMPEGEPKALPGIQTVGTAPKGALIGAENIVSGAEIGGEHFLTNGGHAIFLTLAGDGLKLYVTESLSGAAIYNEFFGNLLLAFVLIFLIGLFAAVMFARQIARPIKQIAFETQKMSRLEPVSAPRFRRDEIGRLGEDVYAMYRNLISTIRRLETEIAREKKMEENQRYFFSAASHELKTPIAGAGVILEGMIEHVIEPEEYPGYLRACRKLMDDQNKLVSEILEIVKLNDEMTIQRRKRLRLRECAVAALGACLPIAASREQHIEIGIDESIRCTADAKLLGKALSNVVLNAVQNSPRGAAIRVYTEQGESARAGAGGCRLCVLNGGARIAEDLLPGLFEPFFRADAARTHEQGHSGLGLTIVKKTLDLMDVPFALENTGDGVLFWMELPGVYSVVQQNLVIPANAGIQ
jgi:two-component system sensor histidine kinase VanS